MKLYRGDEVDKLQSFLASRDVESSPEIMQQVDDILKDVKARGDEALLEYTEKFDGVALSRIQMTPAEITACAAEVSEEFIANLREAAENIRFFHKEMVDEGFHLEKDMGIYMGQKVTPIEKVGVYVPGGRAVYPSTVLMNVIPAQIAGVREIVMVTPPSEEGINPYIAAAAVVCGVDKIYKVGGAQAVAALAYGTETVPGVDKIVGPGNIYVAQAKKAVYGKVDIDMIAGPSEILVIADDGANPAFVAADLLSQAEHDPMASSVLLTVSERQRDAVLSEVARQTALLPKADIVNASLGTYGMAMVCDDIAACIEVSNRIAPEHLELMLANAADYLPLVKNAGSIFLGYYTCESIGDYFGGTNHVLPTNGTARFYSALNVDDFVKKSSYIHWSKEALMRDGAKIMNLAENEDLEAHKNAVKIRMETA
ncbi:MAG: histidinol dehydrogenase [Eubacteriales bacterium]|nr:histidinol dehydrogenase [Eubacteriales bacterium]